MRGRYSSLDEPILSDGSLKQVLLTFDSWFCQGCRMFVPIRTSHRLSWVAQLYAFDGNDMSQFIVSSDGDHKWGHDAL